MPTHRTHFALVLSLTFGLVAACDEGVGDPDDLDFREATGVCLNTGTTPTLKLKTGGVDPDWVMYGDAKEIAGDQMDLILISYSDMDERRATLCKETCDSKGYDFTGESCVSKRDYTFGELNEYKNANGYPRFSMLVDTGKTELGCSCGE